MESITKFFLSFQEIDPGHAALAFFSILFWGYILFLFHPEESGKKIKIILIALFLGFISTRFILALHPILWPEISFKPKKTTILAQTAYIAFIQAGAIEEIFKVTLILLQGAFMSYSWKHKKWDKNIVLIGGFVALGFSLIENYGYIHKDHQNTANLVTMFLGRTIFSSNIHLLINLCFTLFLLKTNYIDSNWGKYRVIIYAFFLAVVQHGVVDFFLLPSARFGTWLAAAFFVGVWVWVAKDLRKYVYVVKTVKEEEVKTEVVSEYPVFPENNFPKTLLPVMQDNKEYPFDNQNKR